MRQWSAGYVIHPKEPPRVDLAQLPTPVVKLTRLGREIGFDPVLLKRDDLTGLELSGNKVRKLEYLMAAAVTSGATSLVTHGGVQSNHCRAAAAIGAKLGLRVRLLLRSDVPDPPIDGNLLLDRLFGAEVTFHHPDEYNGRREKMIEAAMRLEREAGYEPYFFPVGASVPLGCWGYIRCMAELADQLGQSRVVDVFCATSSVGTQAGLILGKALLGCERWRVVGVPVSDSVEALHAAIRELERATVAEYGLELPESATPIELLDGFIGQGYAIPYPEAIETTRLLARTEGILLDPTYTSKAMTGMLSAIREGGLRKRATPIFIHTGGVFGLMARRDLFESP